MPWALTQTALLLLLLVAASSYKGSPLSSARLLQQRLIDAGGTCLQQHRFETQHTTPRQYPKPMLTIKHTLAAPAAVPPPTAHTAFTTNTVFPTQLTSCHSFSIHKLPQTPLIIFALVTLTLLNRAGASMNEV